MKKIIRVWDLPIRAFHWLLVICIVGSLVTINLGDYAIQWHAYFGYSILVLLVFRIVWGFVGSTHARFSTFFPTKAGILDYLSGKSPRGLGHNPIGALSVFSQQVQLIFFQPGLYFYLLKDHLSIPLSQQHHAHE